jgi:effector-binding domain-containing protein
MPYEVTVKQVPPQHVAEVRRHTRVSELATTLEEAFGTLMASMGRVGAEPVGPPFVVYDQIDDVSGRAEIEVCVPVTYRFAGTDEVDVTQIRGGAVASTIHRGPYAEVGPAYRALDEWMRANALVPDGPPREIYLTDPAETSDPADLVTEIEFPVR